MAGDVRVSWVRLTVPTPAVTVQVSWVRLTTPPGVAGTLSFQDTPGQARARSVFEAFGVATVLDLGAPQVARGGTPAQITSTVVTAGLTLADRSGSARGGVPRFAFTLVTAGAPDFSGLPPFILEIDADPSTVGLFTLGTSTLNGTDVIAAARRWIAVPGADVRTATVRRGRLREDHSYDVGTMTVLLDGYSGNYDPDNAATTYQRAGKSLLRTRLGVRLKVSLTTGDVTLYTGELEQTQVDHGRDPTVTWTCSDAMAALGTALQPVPYSREGELSSDRANWLLDWAKIDPADRVVTQGSRTLVGTQGGGTILSNLERVAVAEQGRAYANRFGQIVVSQHWQDYAKTSAVTISDSGVAGTVDYDAITIETGEQQVVNDVTLTQTVQRVVAPSTTLSNVDTPYYAQTVPSVEQFDKRPSPVTVADPLVPLEAQALATYLATVRATPASRLSNVTLAMPGRQHSVLATLCNLGISDKVTVQRTTNDGRALSWPLFVEGIDHTISTSGWMLSLATAPVTNLAVGGATPFRLNVSTLNGTDVLVSY